MNLCEKTYCKFDQVLSDYKMCLTYKFALGIIFERLAPLARLVELLDFKQGSPVAQASGALFPPIYSHGFLSSIQSQRSYSSSYRWRSNTSYGSILYKILMLGVEIKFIVTIELYSKQYIISCIGTIFFFFLK